MLSLFFYQPTKTTLISHLVKANGDNNWQHALILNDINGAYGSVGYPETLRRSLKEIIQNWDISLVVSPGDVVAGQKSSLDNSQVRAMWQGFYQQILLPFEHANIPFALSLGNHDGSKSSRPSVINGSQSSKVINYTYQLERSETEAFWLSHSPELNFINQEKFPYFYHFEFAGGRFVMLDLSGHQILEEEWLLIESMLQHDTTNGPLFVVGHLPLSGVAVSRNKFGEVIQASDKLMALFNKYNVDVYISGHQHAFYPAKYQELFLLNAGGMPARQFVGNQHQVQAQVQAMAESETITTVNKPTVSVLSVNAKNGGFYTTTYEIETLQIVDETLLPDFINGFPYTIHRAKIESH
ncbi:metallophosphoesterase [Psychrosphaera aquimarina]|uniref:Metallophosphoesterase n=1 Tax=Psychrosphaera aquimarina TaxID=2044854 RepID=A0ABU3R0K8_9GAMM|nr:metallophosphoesterase [Psychrosphaera aquimarina]MDU0113216.1 metallophosphoesterase [Psychrosphaera aquimarina]